MQVPRRTAEETPKDGQAILRICFRSEVTSYAVYLAENSTGSQRSQIAVDVPVGTNTLHLPPEKAGRRVVTYSGADTGSSVVDVGAPQCRRMRTHTQRQTGW